MSKPFMPRNDDPEEQPEHLAAHLCRLMYQDQSVYDLLYWFTEKYAYLPDARMAMLHALDIEDKPMPSDEGNVIESLIAEAEKECAEQNDGRWWNQYPANHFVTVMAGWYSEGADVDNPIAEWLRYRLAGKGDPA